MYFSDNLETQALELSKQSLCLLLVAMLLSAFLSISSGRALKRICAKSLIRNIPGPKSDSWITGNFRKIYDVSNIRWHHETTRKYGNVVQIHGMFGDEQLYITDPLALQHIMLKEHNNFEEPQPILVVNQVLVGPGLLALAGDRHKRHRKMLNPFFSVQHLHNLSPIFNRVSQMLCKSLKAQLSASPTFQEINVFEWMSRTALELIAQGGLGTSLDSLQDGKPSQYTVLAKQMIPTTSRLHVLMQLLPVVKPLFDFIPSRIQAFLLKHAPFPPIRKLKHIVDELEATSREVLEQKKAEVLSELKENKGEKSKDILSLLLKANSEASVGERLTDGEVIGHMTTLIFAAQDTTSSALSRILHYLCENPHEQNKLRHEIREAVTGNVGDGKTEDNVTDWDYDKLMSLPYLDAVVRETLRLASPASLIWRVARQSTNLPLARPLTGTDGRVISSIPIAENQGVIIGIAAANRDETIWGAGAWLWKPERWLEGSTGDIDGVAKPRGTGAIRDVGNIKLPGVYSGILSFSGGSRSCIGFRFALFAMKIILATLIEHFAFELSEEEIVWNMSHITSPAVRGKEKEPPQMPLKVRLAQ